MKAYKLSLFSIESKTMSRCIGGANVQKNSQCRWYSLAELCSYAFSIRDSYSLLALIIAARSRRGQAVSAELVIRRCTKRPICAEVPGLTKNIRDAGMEQ